MLINKLKKIIPTPFKEFIKIFLEKLEYQGNIVKCPICNMSLKKFKTIEDDYLNELDTNSFQHSIFQFETFNVTNYHCVNCFSTDRSRLYGIYLTKNKAFFNKKDFNFLDIAPETALSNWIKKNLKVRYRTADKYNKNVDDNVDLTDMRIYDDNSFDFILCSHVLEHIEKDCKALSEIFRVLKSGGRAILMVPILLSLEIDLEIAGIESDADRWKFYGQNDHIRMYSKKGFISKLQNTGFKLTQLDSGYFGNNIFDICGINQRSVLYVVEKP